jgi:hypothetical protein
MKVLLSRLTRHIAFQKIEVSGYLEHVFLRGHAFCRHLTQFTKKGSDPLTFKFVEHHKVSLSFVLLSPVTMFMSLLLVKSYDFRRQKHLPSSHCTTKVSGTWMESFFRPVRCPSKLAGALSTSSHQGQRCSSAYKSFVCPKVGHRKVML